MKIFITVLLVVLVLLTILSPARAITANAYQIGPVQVLIPAQLTINFLASQNTFDSVESIAQSDYTLTKTSSSMTFQTSAIDQFTVTYNVSYASPQSQYVTLGMWSQGSLTNTQKFPVVDATQFTFVVILVTSTPVTYPTTDQILSGIQSRFTSQFDQYQSQLQQHTLRGTRQGPVAQSNSHLILGRRRHSRARDLESGHAGRHGTKPIGVKV